MTIASALLFLSDSNQGGRRVIGNCLLFLVFSILVIDAAPRSKSKGRDGPQLVYDQKQTGDYNIQLHLKDFQIIALLGDDALGDYDYEYDYADFTIKPPSSPMVSTTSKPHTTTNIASTTHKSPSSTSQAILSPEPSTTSKPLNISIPQNSASANSSKVTVSNIHPYPIEVMVYEPPKKPLEVSNIEAEEVGKPSQQTNKKENVSGPSSSEALNSATLSTSEIIYSTTLSSPASSIKTSTPSSSDPMTPGKIKVQILESPTPTAEIAAVPLGIIPGEDVQADVSGGVLQGELASYRKCANGFSRDKKGRCRRVRRPGVGSQLPFGFGRIASNLATRLKLPTKDSTDDISKDN